MEARAGDKSRETGSRRRDVTAGTISAERGRSLMVKLQPSKLITWVRFPSPAPLKTDDRGRSSGVERQLPKLNVASSNLVARSRSSRVRT